MKESPGTGKGLRKFPFRQMRSFELFLGKKLIMQDLQKRV